MKKRWLIILPIAVLVLVLAVLSASVSAQEAGAGCLSETKFNGTIHGDIFFEQQGWMGNSPMSKSFTVPSGTIKVARVYTGVWGGSPGKGGYFNITVNSHTSSNYQACDPCPGAPCANYQSRRCDALNDSVNSGHNQGLDTTIIHDYITGCNVQFIAYNATPYITAGSSNTITVNTSCCDNCTCWDGRIYLIALLVVYEDSSKPNMTYWINEGQPYMEKDSDCDGPDDHDNISFYFNGTIPDSINTSQYCTLGFPHVANASTMELNDYDIGSPNETQAYAGGSYEVLLKWNKINTSWFDTSNYLNYTDTDAYYERVGAAVLKLSVASGPDIVVTDVDVGTPRPNHASTVTATVRNQGNENAGAFNVSLYVNGSYNAKNTSITGLNAGSSTTVSFSSVTLPKGCHTFKVFADCDNDTAESNEDNNNKTVTGQVGYVIEVKKNGDFDTLVTESSDGLFGDGNVTQIGDTYYIRNFTGSSAIENCAGNGISIQNTDKEFVISNCTIKDCTSSGVYMRNLSNGTVNGSCVIQNNSAYGINVYGLGDISNTKLINITDSTITENGIYGIELIGYNCTVRDNTIQNNSDYGVYVNGNDNSIYENEFICNNRDHSARTSQGCEASGTGNDWNSSTIGNYWTDWDDNSGAPGNYSIDCSDSKKDYKPRGLCVFSCNASDDKWAYRYEVNAKPPTLTDNTVPSTEFTTTQYANISADDGVFQSDNTSQTNWYAAHRFNCSINSSISASNISMINVTWNGKGWHDLGGNNNGTFLYLWNGTAYEELANNGGVGTEATLTGGNTSSVSINSGNVTVLAEQKSSHTRQGYKSHIETDYVKLVITPA